MTFRSATPASARPAKLARFISPELLPWLRAMAAEADHLETRTERLLWRAGIAGALVRLVLSKVLNDDGNRPVELTLTAIYLWSSSVLVLAHLVSELLVKGTAYSWREAWFPIVGCFWLAILPSLVGIGIWVCDDVARKLAIVFTAFELANVLAYAHSWGVTEFRVIKFFCTLAVLAAMFTPKVRSACGWRPDVANLLKIT